MPVRAGIEYRGYLWLRTWDFAGRLTAALEQDRTGGEMYASADLGTVAADGAWKQYRFTLRPAQTDPLGAGSRSSSTAGAVCGSIRCR